LPLIQEIFVYHEGNELRQVGEKLKGKATAKAVSNRKNTNGLKPKKMPFSP